MKKIVSLFAIASALLALASCQKEADIYHIDGNKTLLIINASQDDATKTTLSGTTASWAAGDQVTVMYKKTGESAWSTATSSPLAEGGESASFSATLTSPDGTKSAYAIYPANNLEQTEADKAKITIAATQHPTGTSFDGDSDIMISKPFTPAGTVSTQFARLGAVLKIQISNGTIASEKIHSLSVTGPNALAGDVLVSLSDGSTRPAVTGVENGSNTVTAEYAAGDQFTVSSDGNYVYLIVTPQTLAMGSTVTISGETENYTFSKVISLTQDIHLNAGHIIPITVGITLVSLKDKVFFVERFATSTGTFGWSGSVASGSFNTGNAGWTVSNAYGAGGSARLGKASSGLGSAETPSISISPILYRSGAIKLSFKAGAWNAGSENTRLNISSTNCTIESLGETVSSVVMVKGGWTEYTLDIQSITGDIKINFVGNNESNSRFFLDDVCIYYGTKPIASPSLSFVSDSAKAVIGDEFTEPILINPFSVSPIIWSSSDTDVASVDENGIITTISAGTTTIKASYEGSASYLAQEVSYTLTVEAPFITPTIPAVAASDDNATTSFTVTSNIAWTASKGADTHSIIKSISTVGNTVTVTFNENAGDEKTATVCINPTNSDLSASATQVIVTQSASGASNTVTYTVTSKTTVSTSGTAPVGSSASYSQTHNTQKQMTSGDYVTLTLTGFDGKTITAASVSVKSNQGGGAGYLSLSTGGNIIASIGDEEHSKGFNTADWNGNYSTTYVNKDLTITETEIAPSATIVLSISATVNSLYFEALTLTYQ